LLSKAAHHRNRQHWIKKRLPCAICGRPIDYDGPRYINGRQNPAVFVRDHITPRSLARRAGWTEQMINSLANTRPSCQSLLEYNWCSTRRTGSQR